MLVPRNPSMPNIVLPMTHDNDVGMPLEESIGRTRRQAM